MAWLKRFPCALVWLAFLCLPVCRADQSLGVNAAKTKAQLRGEALLITLGIDNSSRRKTSARISLELLDPKDKLSGQTERDESIPAGFSKFQFAIQLSNLKSLDLDAVFWYRLRYRILPSRSTDAPVEPIEGILSVSEIAPEMFELEYGGPSVVRLGARFETLIRAVQPATLRPVGGVKLRATLDVSDTDSVAPLKSSAVTDSEGYARLTFLLPENADTDSPGLDVVGERDGYTAKLEDEEPRTFHFSRFLLNTDKPLYQPGQTLQARVLVFGPNRRALANQPLEFRIYDPENTLVFRSPANTSNFGIASMAWQIPSNERLGSYRVQADFGEDDSEDGNSSTIVKISRYDLPTFAVSTKSDRKYYLADQNAEVDVSADYLFGRPVTRGHVRVVREEKREWNYREQKWEVEAGTVYEGEADSSGHFLAKIDLAQDHKELAGDDYERFRDVAFTAYFTDSTSERTEHRRFDLRITKDPIHVYVIRSDELFGKHIVDFYISTFYGDGRPAPCDVSIRLPQTNAAAGEIHSPALLRTVRTNAYGLAKVFDLPISGEQMNHGQLSLAFEAKDKTGATGTHTEDFWIYGSQTIAVETDKALYSPDDPIEVKLTSDETQGTVEVEAESDGQFISSQMVHLHNGKAQVALAPNAKFEGPVTIHAYSLGERSAEDPDETNAQGSHTVLFPHDTSLKIDLRLSKAAYRPGEEAQADFHVGSSDGEAAKSALGIVVVDKAVEERERTDEDLQNNWGFDDWGSGYFSLFSAGDREIAGVRRRDLDKIDLSKPLPAGFDLLAEILLQEEGNGAQFDSSGTGPNLDKLFASIIDPPFTPTLAALREQATKGINPGGEEGIRKFLLTTGLDNLRDPWGTAYRVVIAPIGANYKVTIMSAGPDQKFGTADDFDVASENWPYFAQWGEMIQKAVEDYHARTGGYIRDWNVLQSELLKQGLNLTSLRDPWRHGYRADFGIEQNLFTVEVESAGPDGKFSEPGDPSTDDVIVSKCVIGYFDDTRYKMDAALQGYYHDQGRFPQNLADLRAAFGKAGIDWESLRDPWGHLYYATFRQEARYSDSVVVESYSEHQAGQHTAVRPVTVSINYVDIRSAGPDGKEGTLDDFDAAVFSRATYEGATAGGSGGTNPPVVFSGELGAITGTVTDPTGAAIANASITGTRYGTGEVYKTESDGDGHYLLRNVRPGAYEVHIVVIGFRDDVFTQVPVGSSAITQLNAEMQVGAVSETVTVTESAAVPLQTTMASVSSVKAIKTTAKSAGVEAQTAALSTPRLREYFPETLLWSPEVITDAQGTAHLKFPLADSITTWNLRAIASTADGRIGTVEKPVRSFQPFFADQDLPQFLTAGDKIDLPVIVRNFLPRSESVRLSVEPEPWFTALGSAAQHADIAADSAARLSFPIEARTPTSGTLRVVAVGKAASDAIQKKTTVRPFGEEQHTGDSQILGDSAELDVSIPSNALPGSIDGELKLYPNLMAHVWEAITAILERPWGCGEQTISSTYPSILLLQYAKRAGRENSPEVVKARRFAQLGYDRLLSYATEDGGFSYWGHGDPADLSLTAYAVMFLRDAQDVIPVDESVSRKAESWLVGQMKSDGHWPAKYYWSEAEDPSRSAMVTAYIARVLAMSKAPKPEDTEGQQLAIATKRALANAFTWLGGRVHEQDEPYLIASYAEALLESDDPHNRTLALQALSQLKSLTHREDNANYWSLETNTPFYGWGRAGRLETTALVVEAFELAGGDEQSADRALIDGGILYLLHNQDQYGIWYSTQATFNVLRALASSVSPSGEIKGTESSATVFVDGKTAAKIELPSAGELSGPVVADLSKFLGPGEHDIRVSRPPGSAKASVQLATTYYLPWTQYSASQSLHREQGSAEALRIAVMFDRTDAKVGQPVTCRVKAERVDFRGYGMMLGEIGLPPGAEVDRDSLGKAMSDSKWDIDHFDVLPDRVIVYLWPRAGGTSFSFTFTTRFGIDAETAPSVLYDYYNPDARSVVMPVHFLVQ